MNSYRVGQSHPGGDHAARVGPVERARSQYLYGLVSVGLVAATVFLVFAPSQALVGRGQSQVLVTVSQIAPQGWAFFTRDPRQAYLSLYQQRDGSWEQVNSTSVAGAESYFGFDRGARTETYEMEVISAGVPDQGWVSCDEEEIRRCLPQTPSPEVSVSLHGESPRFCGTVAVTSQEPVPWAWAGKVEEMPGEFSVLDVECHEFERGRTHEPDD